MIMIHKAAATGRLESGEFDDTMLPVFEIQGDPDEQDGRIELPDGSLVYAIDELSGTGLYRLAIAMDAGDNVRRRFLASKRGLGGITAATGPDGTGLSGQRGQLTCVGDKQVGWLETRTWINEVRERIRSRKS
jgi:hypothetical protein